MKRLLVANRSEIAIRIFRAATELGLTTIAVYADQDKLSLHRFKADEAYLIGKTPGGEPMGPIDAYLSIDEIMRVAREARADAIHPGYGFLSESPEFVDACRAAGIVFIGPSPETMRTLGNKVSARNLAVSVDVPVMPATAPLPDDEAEIMKLADGIGFPVMLKGLVGRRRPRHAADQGPEHVARRGEVRQARGQVGLRQGRGVSRKARRARQAHRGAAARRHPRHGGAPLRARLLDPAPQPEGGGARAGGLFVGREAQGDLRRGDPHRRGDQLRRRRHRWSSCSTPIRTISTSSRSTRASRSSIR